MKSFFNHKTWSFCVLNVLLGFVASASLVQAQEAPDEDVIGYDAIVNELQNPKPQPAARSQARVSRSQPDPFENIWLHAGVGFVSNLETLTYPDGGQTYLSQRGVQASLGIDLFSEHISAEGLARSYTPLNYSRGKGANTNVSLQEFELRFLYKNRIAPQLSLKAGLGLAARYMTIERENFGRVDYTTPSSVGVLGFDVFLSPSFSVGAELCARSALISETMDQSAIDGTIRIDTHF